MSSKCAVAPPPFRHHTRSITTGVMSGYPEYPATRPGNLTEMDSFTQQLQMAWGVQSGPQDQSLRQEQPLVGSPRNKGLPGSSFNDVQLRRDIDSSGGGGFAPSHAALQQLQQQLGGSSGPGSDTAGSVQHSTYHDEVQKPAKRGRGRQRKNTGVETAQQRAHRRFYERKKQRMSALEQEAREKQEEYQQLLALNIELRRKHEALERAVAGRDEHMLLIQALGSLSLASRARQDPPQQHQAMQHLPALQEQQLELQPALQQQAQHTQQQQQQPMGHMPQQELAQLQHLRSRSNPMQPIPHGGSWAHLQDMARSESAPSAAAAAGAASWQQQQPKQEPNPQQQPPADLIPQVEEAGPFGMVQLPQYGSADVEALPVLLAGKGTAATAAAGQAAPGTGLGPNQQQQEQCMSWEAQPLDLPAQQQQGPGQQQQGQWAAGGFLDLLNNPGMSLTRSLSMPARTGGFDADLFPAGQPSLGLGLLQPGGLDGQQQQPSRSFSTTPTAWLGRAGNLRTSNPGDAAAGADWDLGAPFGASAAREGRMLAPGQQQQQLLPLGSSRHHSWSGAAGADSHLPAGLLPRASVSFAAGLGPGQQGGLQADPFSQQGQLPGAMRQPPQQQQQQPMWGTVTTTGPMSAAAPHQQQQMQLQPADAFQGFTLPSLRALQPSLQAPHPPQQQQQQQGNMPPPPQQQQQQMRSAVQHPEPQQVVQQLQQMGDMAFSADLAGTAAIADDFLLFDADMMDMLMERLSQQQSVEMMSPLPSIPSALLTGDSLRQALADMAGAAAAGGPPAVPANPPTQAPGQDPTAGFVAQQQQQQPAGMAAMAAAAAPASPPVVPEVAGPEVDMRRYSGSPPTLLEASRQLQARHMAAGFFPARIANEMFYVHEIVDWYKTKLQQLQQLLPYVDRPCPDVPCSVSLVQAMEEVIDGVRKFGTRNRIGMWELKLMNLETGDFEEPPAAHWAMVADHIQLPPQMRESAIACYSLYLEYVDKVKQDRIDVLRDFQMLEQQLDAAAGGCGCGCAPLTLQYRVDGYEEYQQLLDRLQLSLKREHMVANMLSYSLSQIASHVQMAKGMLACWPYWPDGPSVLTFWLAEEQARAQLLPGRQPGM